MSRLSLCTLLLLVFTLPATTFADNNLKDLESIAGSGIQVQPGLKNYLARVETSRIEEMMQRLTKGIPADVAAPQPPVVYKFWQSSGPGIVYAEGNGLNPYVEKVVKQVSGHLAIELNRMLLPADRAGQRKALTQNAKIKTNEVILGNDTIKQVEINFEKPTDLDEAFYVKGMRLPQKQVTSLAFDIENSTKTINEMKLTTAEGLQLTVEIRYINVANGFIPERFHITSPDGQVDDVFEASFTDVEGYLVPESMRRIIRRPNIQEDLEISFKNYRINQPVSADIQKRLNEQ